TNGRKRVGRTSAAPRAAAKSSRQPCHPNGTMRLQRGVVRVVVGSMCRWLAYSGSPVLLEELLYGPENSLIVQSLHSRMGAEGTNGDGFGVGWDGGRETPAVFHSVEPAWNDRNLRDLSEHITSAPVCASI